MEQKTIFEELIDEHSPKTAKPEPPKPAPKPQKPVDQELVSQLVTAYTAIGDGEWQTADKLLDKVLQKDPENERALSGKELIKRCKDVRERTAVMLARLPDDADKAGAPPIPEAVKKAEDESDDTSPYNFKKPPATKSNMGFIVLVLALTLMVSAVVAAIAIGMDKDSSAPEESPAVSESVTEHPGNDYASKYKYIS